MINMLIKKLACLNKEIDKDKLFKFINDNVNLKEFEVIFKEAILYEFEEIEEEKGFTNDNDINAIKNTANSIEVNQRATINKGIKQRVKGMSDYRCACEDLNSCLYFTSKEDNCNYLEIHHLIPVEFHNEFEDSIEIIQNYVALCPNCHRMIHHGADRERKPMITYLFKKRKDALARNNIKIEEKQLLQYYYIEK